MYVPEGKNVIVDLGEEGTFSVEWLTPDQGTLLTGDALKARKAVELAAPFAGNAVLYLVRR